VAQSVPGDYVQKSQLHRQFDGACRRCNRLFRARRRLLAAAVRAASRRAERPAVTAVRAMERVQDRFGTGSFYNQIALSLAYVINQKGLALNLDGAPLCAAPSSHACAAARCQHRLHRHRALANGIQLFREACRSIAAIPWSRHRASGDGSDQKRSGRVSWFEQRRRRAQQRDRPGTGGKRADTLSPLGAQLLYVQCPQAPFWIQRCRCLRREMI